MKQEQAEFKTALGLTNKRLDDMNAHLVDQSRRSDDINKRIDDTNARLERFYEGMVRLEDHSGLAQRVARPEENLQDLKDRQAA